MGLFSSSSKSSSTDNRQAATDQGVNVQQGTYVSNTTVNSTDASNAASGLGKLVRDSAVLTGDDSTSVGARATLNTGINLSGVGGNVTLGDTAGVESISKQYARTIESISADNNSLLRAALDNQSAVASEQNARLSGLLSNSLGSMSTLGLSNQTGGQSETNKTILYAVLAVLALGGVVIFTSSRR